MDRVKRIWYVSPMRAAKVQARLRIHAHTSSESRGTFRQKARSLVPLNGWACAVKICHDGMLEDTNSLDGAQIKYNTTATVAKRVNSHNNCFYSNMSNVTRKPVFAVCNLLRLKPACSADETSYGLEISAIASRGIILSRQWTTKALIRLRRWADELRLCCLHMT